MAKTKQEKQELAEEDLAKKLRLEKPLAVQSRAILNTIAADLGVAYAATGTVIDATEYEDDFIGVLRPSYRRAEADFGNTMSQDLKEPKSGEDPSPLFSLFVLLASIRAIPVDQLVAQYQAKKANRLRAFTDSTVPVRAGLITKTNQSEIEKAIATAVAEAAESPDPVPRTTIGARATKLFRQSAIWRGQTIATTEIQTASEGAKDIESQSLDEALSPLERDGLIELDRVKEWHTQGDEKVRPDHVLADLQRRRFDAPFTVGSESLMYPGDGSLGATAKNLINCRCSALYFMEGRVERVITANSDTGVIPIGSLDIV